MRPDETYALKIYNLSCYQKVQKDYYNYPSEKKIEIEFIKRSVFNLELNTIKKMYKLKKMEDLEKKLVMDFQNFLQNKIWFHEGVIYSLYTKIPIDDPLREEIYKKIEDEEVSRWPYESGMPRIRSHVTKKDYEALSLQEKIKAGIFKHNIYTLDINALKKRKLQSLKSRTSNEYEKLYLKESLREKKGLTLDQVTELYLEELPKDYLFLEHRSNTIEILLSNNERDICKIYFEELPEDYPYRKELLEEMQDARVSGSNYQEIKAELLDQRNIKKFPINYFFAEDEKYNVYNYIALNKSFDEYSPKKKLEIDFANRYLTKLRINALEKFRISKKMDEFEQVIFESTYTELIRLLDLYDRRINHVYLNELLPDAPYRVEIDNKMDIANFFRPYRSGEVILPEKPLPLNFEELTPEDKIRSLIMQRSLLAAECDVIIKEIKSKKIEGYEKIIFKSFCSATTKQILLGDNTIYHLYHYMIEKDNPHREEIREKILDANISEKVPKASCIVEE